MTSEKSNPDKPSSLPPGRKLTSTSGEHKLNLTGTLSSKESEELVKKGRAQVVALSPEVKENNEDRPSQTNIEEASGDLQEAAGAFVHGVDVITDSLFFIIGKFDKTISRINFSIMFTSVAIACLSYLIIRVEKLTSELDKGRQSNAEITAKLKDTTDKLDGITQGQKETDKKVEETKQEVAKQQNIQIVADEKTGQAKVVIKPKEKPTTAPTIPSASSGVHSIEIPIKLPPGSKTVESDSGVNRSESIQKK
jgi:hypothetical protein